MGTYFDNEGLHWSPIAWFPWIERSHGIRTVRGAWVMGNWYRWAPMIIEESEDLRGMVMQTIQFKDGSEQIRQAPWRCSRLTTGGSSK